MPKQTQFKPKQTQFLSAISVADQRQKMLPHLTINPRRVSLCYYAGQINDPNTYDRKAKKYRSRYPALNFPKKGLRINDNWQEFRMKNLEFWGKYIIGSK